MASKFKWGARKKQGLCRLLSLDPSVASDKMAYNDDAVLNELHRDPSQASKKLKFFINGKSVRQYPLLILCALEASKETIALAYNANPESIHDSDEFGWTPLHIVCSNGSSTEVVQFLASVAGNVGTTAKDKTRGWTPVHLLCRYKAAMDKVEAVLQVGGPPCLEISTTDGNVPLHYAILCESPLDVVTYMVKTNGSTVSVKNNDGRTPMDYAKKKKLPNSTIKQMKRAALSSQSVTAPTTRAELDRLIFEFEDTLKIARENENVDTSILDKAISAKETLTWLYPLRDSLKSEEEIQDSINEMKQMRDSYRHSGEFEQARQVSAAIDEMEKKKEIEVEAKRQINAPKDMEHSRKVLFERLMSNSAGRAEPLALGFLQQATNNFSKKNSIGKGGFSEVFHATDPESGISFAVKRFTQHVILGDVEGRVREKIKAEIKGLSKFDHHNIVRLLGFHITNNNTEPQCLVYELAAGGSLSDLLATEEGRKSLSWRKRIRAALSVVSAELYLCSRNCYHRDVKPQNICFWSDLEKVILIDLGIAEFLEDDSFQSTMTGSRFAGSRPYAAPEYLSENRFGQKSEVYSVGMVIKVLISGKLAGRRGLANDGMDVESPDFDHVDPLAGEWDQDVLARFKSVGRMCTLFDRRERPTMQELFIELDDIESKSQRSLTVAEQGTIDSALSASMRRTHESVDLTPSKKIECLYCGRNSQSGLLCPDYSATHFSCRRCFREHVLENLGEEHIRCRIEGCRSPLHAGTDFYEREQAHVLQALAATRKEY